MVIFHLVSALRAKVYASRIPLLTHNVFNPIIRQCYRIHLAVCSLLLMHGV